MISKYQNDKKWAEIVQWSSELGINSWGKEIVHMHTINKNLYMGSRLSAQEVIDKGNLIDQNKVIYDAKTFYLMCIASKKTCEYCEISSKYTSYNIKDDGTMDDESKKIIEKVADSIHKKLRRSKLLVHCHSGRNRSALAILAYCARYTDYTYENALYQIRYLNSHRFPMQSTLQNSSFTSFMRSNWDSFKI